MQAALAVVIERWQPELRDAEFGYKLARMRNLLAKDPDRLLVVGLGSSRTQLGFRPSTVTAACEQTGQEAVAFNFGLVGAGPFLELLCLHRLLDQGIRPDVVVVEVLAPRMNGCLPADEADGINRNRLGWKDWPLLERFASAAVPTDHRRWLRAQLTPWSSHRLGILSRYTPRWLPWKDRQDGWLHQIDRTGWMAYSKELTPEGYRHGLDYARREYAGALRNFCIGERADRALRELLAVCRRESIIVVLVLMPEGTEFQSWYPSAACTEIDAYLSRLSREESVQVVDARSWVPDDCFADGHHLIPRGSDQYSSRLGREVIHSLLQRRTVEKDYEPARKQVIEIPWRASRR